MTTLFSKTTTTTTTTTTTKQQQQQQQQKHRVEIVLFIIRAYHVQTDITGRL